MDRKKLENGARIIGFKPISALKGDEGMLIILTHNEADDEYATYVFNVKEDGEFWGHYYSTLDAALENFNERTWLSGSPPNWASSKEQGGLRT